MLPQTGILPGQPIQIELQLRGLVRHQGLTSNQRIQQHIALGEIFRFVIGSGKVRPLLQQCCRGGPGGSRPDRFLPGGEIFLIFPASDTVHRLRLA